MNVAYQDLDINQGSTHVFELIIYEDDAQTEVADLTGFQARGQIRKVPTSPEIAASFVTSIGPSETVEGLDGNNAITLSLSSTVTSGLIEHDYGYDVELYSTDTNGETVFRVLEGRIYIKPAITR